MKNNLVKIFIVFVLVFLANSVNAQTVDEYARTPSDAEISDTSSINFSGIVTYFSNVDSYFLRVADVDFDSIVYSSCIDVATDEVIFNIDMVLPIDGYAQVALILFTGDNNCEDDPIAVALESGDPAFSVVPAPVGNCEPLDKVCYYDWLVMNLVFLFLISVFIFTGFVRRLFPFKQKD